MILYFAGAILQPNAKTAKLHTTLKPKVVFDVYLTIYPRFELNRKVDRLVYTPYDLHGPRIGTRKKVL